MIDSKELMIGNLVLHKSMICEVKYLGVSHAGLSFDKKGNHREFNASYKKECSPIPLTEEWMFKYGFEKKDHAGVCYGKSEILIYLSGHAYFDLSDKFPAKIIYVHQLQNLYYALTGKELTIEPEH